LKHEKEEHQQIDESSRHINSIVDRKDNDLITNVTIRRL